MPTFKLKAKLVTKKSSFAFNTSFGQHLARDLKLCVVRYPRSFPCRTLPPPPSALHQVSIYILVVYRASKNGIKSRIQPTTFSKVHQQALQMPGKTSEKLIAFFLPYFEPIDHLYGSRGEIGGPWSIGE